MADLDTVKEQISETHRTFLLIDSISPRALEWLARNGYEVGVQADRIRHCALYAKDCRCYGCEHHGQQMRSYSFIIKWKPVVVH